MSENTIYTLERRANLPLLLTWLIIQDFPATRRFVMKRHRNLDKKSEHFDSRLRSERCSLVQPINNNNPFIYFSRFVNIVWCNIAVDGGPSGSAREQFRNILLCWIIGKTPVRGPSLRRVLLRQGLLTRARDALKNILRKF